MDDSWLKYYIGIAELTSTRSRDNSTQVGCVIVNPKSKAVLSMGYNDFPMGIDDAIPNRRIRPEKYDWTEHAERNSIFLAARHGTTLEGSWLIMNYEPKPCMDCARAIVQAGIICVAGPDRPFDGVMDCRCTKTDILFQEAGVDQITVVI